MQKNLKRGTVPKKSKSRVRYCMLRGKPFWFSSLGQQVQLIWRAKRGIILHFFNIHCCKTSKKLKGDPLVSSGMVCYAGKEKKLFWFSSLGQMSQFGTIKLCRTFKNYFGQFVWIEKKKKSHYNSRVSLHEAPTKNWC